MATSDSSYLVRGQDPRMTEYLKDPLLRVLHDGIAEAGSLRSISLDLTEVCNLRCQGCYFFVENMDDSKAPRDEDVFDAFIKQEKQRGTNYVTVLGGEPSLFLERLKKLHDNFLALTVTNGLNKIPMEGFETMPINVSVWGDHKSDTKLRGGGNVPVFRRALDNYRNDPRACFYYTVASGCAHEIESVVTQCVENGNFVYFSYYEDNAGLGGDVSHEAGFERVQKEIDRMIERFPDRIVSTSYMNQVGTSNQLLGQPWGYDVCPTVSVDLPRNATRIANGNPYNIHFRAYMADLKATRRCCVSEDRDCSQCRNAYAKHTWIMINRTRHLETLAHFTRWLTTVYSFYLVVHAVDVEKGRALLPEIHKRLHELDSASPSTVQGPRGAAGSWAEASDLVNVAD